MIAIVDYGAGNLKSVKNAMDYLKVESKITDRAEDIEKADKLILPGVGNFGGIMGSLRKKRLITPIKEAISTKPYLGICLGMQILFGESEESPGVKGLGVFKGNVKRFASKTLFVRGGFQAFSMCWSPCRPILKK